MKLKSLIIFCAAAARPAVVFSDIASCPTTHQTNHGAKYRLLVGENKDCSSLGGRLAAS